MPLTFPTSPTNGQTVTLSGTTYTYNATKGVWEATASGGGFVAGSFSEHILPDANDTYDIGSASNKIRDIYVSDNSLHIGDHTMSADSEGINIPALKIGTGSNRVKLTANAEGKLRQVRTVDGVAQEEEGISSDAGTTAVDTFAELQASPVVAGKTVLVRNTNKLYINTGTGWYVVGQVTNESPTAITGLDATYSLALDGTATVITMNSTDPEGFPLTWSHAVTTGTLGSTATITNVDNVFTITPSSTEADAGSFSVTFSASDGSQAATSVSDFTLEFAPAASSVLFTSDGSSNSNGTTGTYTTHSWTVPNGVTSIAGVVIGSGAGASQRKPTSDSSAAGEGGGGGALSYVNNIAVTPGETLTILVGNKGARKTNEGAAGGISAIRRGSTNLVSVTAAIGGANIVAGNYLSISPYLYGGRSQGGTVQVGTGGSGGHGGRPSFNGWGTGGGGAGGYSGNGGDGYGGDRPSGGDQSVNPSNDLWGLSGAGGGGAGGGAEVWNNGPKHCGGGGVGPYGEGASGVGVGGSGSASYAPGGSGGGQARTNGRGGLYGGGGGAHKGAANNFGDVTTNSGLGAEGDHGVVRIMWGDGRAYPSTNVDNSHNVDAETVV